MIAVHCSFECLLSSGVNASPLPMADQDHFRVLLSAICAVGATRRCTGRNLLDICRTPVIQREALYQCTINQKPFQVGVAVRSIALAKRLATTSVHNPLPVGAIFHLDWVWPGVSVSHPTPVVLSWYYKMTATWCCTASTYRLTDQMHGGIPPGPRAPTYFRIDRWSSGST